MQPNKIDLLACRAVNGDRRAADCLFVAVLADCKPAINKYRRFFEDRHDALSAAGVAYTNALRDWQPWSGPFSSFFLRAFSGYAKRAARDRFRHARRVSALASETRNSPDFLEPITECDLDRTSLLSRAAAALDGHQLDVFEAVRSGEQQNEIARRLGVSVQNVNQILSRALDRVRDELAIEIAQGA
jgi:RNA polymerase sigma factor (sigma-70 family)